MSKPILKVEIATIEGKTAKVTAVFDTGSFYTIIREDCMPEGAIFPRFPEAQYFKTANRGGRLKVVGATVLAMTIGERMIRHDALIASNLSREMLVGAGTMQTWDITIRNQDGKTQVIIGRDMRDPEITEVD